MLKNVEIHFPDRTPEPTLYEVIEKLALAKPNLKFVHGNDLIHHNVYIPMQPPRGFVRSQDRSFAIAFRVIDNGAIAGTITIGHHYSRREGSPGWHIGVSSHLINNSRGPRSTVYTSDVAKAVSNAKKYLVGKALGRILYEKYEEADSVLRSVLSSLRANISRGAFLTSSSDAQILLHAYMTNNLANVSHIESAMRAKLDTPAFETSLSEFYLAQHCFAQIQRKQHQFVYRHGESYTFFTDTIPNTSDEADKVAVTVMDFDQLPLHMQEKIGVLQLLQNREIVKDVGLRADEDSFVLM